MSVGKWQIITNFLEMANFIKLGKTPKFVQDHIKGISNLKNTDNLIYTKACNSYDGRGSYFIPDIDKTIYTKNGKIVE